MEKQIKLYKEAEALCEELKSSDAVHPAEAEKFVKLVKEFFENPSQTYGFSSAIIWKKINWMFQNYFDKYFQQIHGGDGIDNFNKIVLQCRIDCFFARFIELYDLNTSEEILESTKKVTLSDEIEDLLDKAWDDVNGISLEVAEYLAKSHVGLDNMSEMVVGLNETVQSKFIDYPDIPEYDGLWVRVWITVDKDQKVSVRVIIVPQEKGGAAIPYDITSACKEWIETLE